MYKNRSTGFWEHDFRVTGIPRYHASYGVTKRADAEPLHAAAVALFRSKALDVIEAWRRGDVSIEQLAEIRAKGEPFANALIRLVTVEPWPSVEDAITSYLKGLDENENRSARTRQLAEWELTPFVKFLEARYPDALSALDSVASSMIDAYQSFLIGEGKKPNTVTTYVSRVGSLFRWMRRREERDAREEKRPARALHIPLDPETISRKKTRRERFLSPEEAERLIAATPRPFLFPVAAALFGGFRIDEMAHFRPGHDVDLTLGLLSVQRQPDWSPKTVRSVRHVPIASVLRPLLEYHMEHYASRDWVTPSRSNPNQPVVPSRFRVHFRRIVADANLITGRDDPKGVTYHTLRHTFASWLLMRGTDVFTVSKLLGNTVQQVEDTYGHLAADFRQSAVDRLSNAIRLPSLDSGKSATTTATDKRGKRARS